MDSQKRLVRMSKGFINWNCENGHSFDTMEMYESLEYPICPYCGTIVVYRKEVNDVVLQLFGKKKNGDLLEV
jgi:hypothetical protein